MSYQDENNYDYRSPVRSYPERFANVLQSQKEIVTGENVTPLSEVKEWLAQDSTIDDALLTRMIKAAELQLAEFGGIAIQQIDVRVRVQANRCSILKLPYPAQITAPVVTFSPLQYQTGTPVENSDYKVDTSFFQYQVEFLTQATYDLAYTSGFDGYDPAVTEKIKSAVCMTVADWYENRTDEAYKRKKMMALPLEARDLLAGLVTQKWGIRF